MLAALLSASGDDALTAICTMEFKSNMKQVDTIENTIYVLTTFPLLVGVYKTYAMESLSTCPAINLLEHINE